MRELKFRVWDNDDKLFVKGVAPSFLGDLDGHFIFNKDYHIFYGGISGQKSKNWTLQQYTGLKDKNGKEIYEGDIIKAYHWDGPGLKDKDMAVGEVKYNEDLAYYEIKRGIFRISLYLLDDWLDVNLAAKGMSTLRTNKINRHRLEIIGNTMENPDLLK